MDFTREPIIETIISAKEGHKLLVRSSKINGAEEYSVDAVEVISFGTVQFFRAQEKPRPFLAPVTDYEVLEVREMRLPIKSATHERTIKIAPKKGSAKKPKADKPSRSQPKEIADTEAAKEPQKKRTRRRTRRRKDEETGNEEGQPEGEPVDQQEIIEKPKANQSFKRKAMVPPPTTLISETISRYKNILVQEEASDKKQPPALPKELLEEKTEKTEKAEVEEAKTE